MPWDFQQLMALPECTAISIKIGHCYLGYIMNKTAYSLRESLPPILKTVAVNTAIICLFIKLCISLHTCLIVTSWEFLSREKCVNQHWSVLEICILLCWKQHAPTWFSQFISHFFSDFYKTIKYLNLHNAFSKISLSLLTAHVKIGYTFHGPWLHWPDSTKPLPELMFTHNQCCTVAFNWRQFHMK